jgi:phosphoenolpyruvate carboxylase
MLYRAGSRPAAREPDEWDRLSKIEHPSQLRAIPNNAILQQLGFMAVTLHGTGRAISKDPELFHTMCKRSARFGRSIQMVSAALDRTEIDVLRAYVSTLNPAIWLNEDARARRLTRVKALRELARLTLQFDLHDRLARALEMDVPSAVERLRLIFRYENEIADKHDDYGEISQYRIEPALSYAIELRCSIPCCGCSISLAA